VNGERTGSASDATQHEFVGGQKLFGRYTLIKILGRGGMGIVWLAHDEELERDVALKFLPDLIVHDAAVLSDLKHETKRCLELTHKNIVRIYDFVHDERSGCISMEYIDGDTLSSLRCDKERRVFETAELTDWISQLCDALDYAHNYAHIIHRDLKPANLMVNQRGELKVSDFGIARSVGDSMSQLTMQQGRSGTLSYMSPQQLEGERGTHLDDIYSLGASVYELLTSKPPFYVGNIDRQIREKIPPSMAERRKEFEIEAEPIPAVWEEWVAACLAKDPTRRPQSVREIARQLHMPSPEARPPPVRAFFQRKKKRVLALGLASLCVLALGGWYFGIFMTVLWLNWKLPARRCLMMRGYSGGRVSSRGVKGTGKSPREIWSARWSWTRAILNRCRTAWQGITRFFGAMRKQNPGWPAHWLLNLTMPLRK
jgi:serine/threonine protein kinase